MCALPALFTTFCELNSDTEAVVAGDERLTFGDLDRISERVAGGLVARGIEKGQEVEKGLLLQKFETNRQGTQLLMPAEHKIAERIKQFFAATVGKKDLPWKERKSPID